MSDEKKSYEIKNEDIPEEKNYMEMTLEELEQELHGFDEERMISLLRSDHRIHRSKPAENVLRLQEITKIIKKHELTKNPMSPERLRLIIEDLGPTFIKMGQILSKRTDILPQNYCDELEKLCEDSRPLPIESVEEVIEEQFGKKLGDIFTSFEAEPIGSASIGQVHAAVLKSGQHVVVKVQRPGVEEMMRQDIMLLRRLVTPLKLAPKVGDSVDFKGIIEELWKVSQEELNYLIEAVHTIQFRNLNADEPGINCPMIIKSLTTARVMTMEYIEGCSIGDNAKLDALSYDRDALGSLMIQNYIKQVLDDGFFHADPHQGNLMVRGDELVWIDLGMTGTLTKQERSAIKQAIRAFVKRDNEGLIRAMITIGAVKGDINHHRLYSDIDFLLDKYYALDLGDMNIGAILSDVIQVVNDNNIVLPSGISVLARGLVIIEGVLSKLSPDTNVIQIAQKYVRKDMWKGKQIFKTMRQEVQTLAASTEKAVEIPGLASDLLKATLRGQTKINLDLESSKPLMEEFNRIMNNLIICIITASLLLASSLICTTSMKPQILGIPALGFIGYILALALGLYLIIKSHFKGSK